MRKLLETLLFLFLITASCKTVLPPEKSIKKLGKHPYIELDGKAVSQEDFKMIDENNIAVANPFYNKEAKRKFGEKAKDGAVIFQSKEYATKQYETLFSNLSPAYKELLMNNDKGNIQYILNERVLTSGFEGTLSVIKKSLLKEIKIIDQQELSSQYQILDKKIGVLIKAKPPKNLYKGKEKF
jgi:hypothetical protein